MAPFHGNTKGGVFKPFDFFGTKLQTYIKIYHTMYIEIIHSFKTFKMGAFAMEINVPGTMQKS